MDVQCPGAFDLGPDHGSLRLWGAMLTVNQGDRREDGGGPGLRASQTTDPDKDEMGCSQIAVFEWF